jgi:hypothetical protein
MSPFRRLTHAARSRFDPAYERAGLARPGGVGQ